MQFRKNEKVDDRKWGKCEMKKIFIYGTGRIGNRYYNTIQGSSIKIVGFIETQKSTESFRGIPVYSVGEAIHYSFDEIHVANTYLDTLLELLKRNVPKEQIYICNYDLYLQYAGYCNGKMDLSYKGDLVLTQAFLKRNIINSSEMNVGNTLIQGNLDYCRYGVLQLLADEIKKNDIVGDIAELGVFRGDFARLMNALLPERFLYLFDTFEGFIPEEQRYEQEHHYADKKVFIGDRDFKNTSVELVMGKMQNPPNCIIRKGKFPDTIPSGKHEYALVSIDCDLYLPVLEGLKYFYPRLSVGGYIMLHDYNSVEFMGMEKAVKECEKLFGHIMRVPIPDKYGSLVIGK